MSRDTAIWTNEVNWRLAEALVLVNTLSDMQNFLRDVMTEKEIIEISTRLEAARLLRAGCTYGDITAKTGLSSRTVARINGWLQNGCGGYTTALEKLNDHHHGHKKPARAV